MHIVSIWLVAIEEDDHLSEQGGRVDSEVETKLGSDTTCCNI